MIQVFNRQQFDRLWITIESNETLGVLDSDYIEDYFGVDGQLTLHSLATDARTPILMSSVAENTSFTGFIELSNLVDGDYQLEGTVRDVVGNYTVISASAVRSGPITPLQLKVSSRQIIAVFPARISLSGGMLFTTPIPTVAAIFETAIKTDLGLTTQVVKTSVFNCPIVKYQLLNHDLKGEVTFVSPLIKTMSLEASIEVFGNGS